MNRTKIPCEQQACMLGQRAGYSAGPAKAGVAWHQRSEEYTAWRFVGTPPQSSDRALLCRGSLEDCEAAIAGHSHTGDQLQLAGPEWVDEPRSIESATALLRQWLAEAERATEAARAEWESLPVGDPEAAQRSLAAFLAQLRSQGLRVATPEVGHSPARREAAKRLWWWESRRNVWAALLAAVEGRATVIGCPTPATLLFRALQVWCDPEYPMSDLCQPELRIGEQLYQEPANAPA